MQTRHSTVNKLPMFESNEVNRARLDEIKVSASIPQFDHRPEVNHRRRGHIAYEYFVDSSYATHIDIKSHTGGCAIFYRGAFMSKSIKQLFKYEELL